jgi:hypothetical protein
MSNVKAREWPKRNTMVTPYSLRRQVKADMKADGKWIAVRSGLPKLNLMFRAQDDVNHVGDRSCGGA